jgi:hypothetical protein
MNDLIIVREEKSGYKQAPLEKFCNGTDFLTE